ncbi:hypothetical protein [Bacterioplanoides sp. SCSIO 12839]|uniref:hypothetical protein n=1 Tax=Bacterioplanoides sp. SCSIO 12839 TaxID=2829569 RepID=UPI002107C3F8|nr:hypothetical protein [Bacterioplanoides sp. SCSIO 12839]UTW49711.1 hypothetical protein KFF03_07450 [Bacterioplanoides sp. SCSIO 12839]
MRLFLMTFLMAFPFASLAENTPDYTVVGGQFFSDGERIPAGCFAQLMTELNGDNSVAAVYLGRNSYRGCMAANFPYPGGDEVLASYNIIKQLADHHYQIEVCVSLESGSLGKNCDNLQIEFVMRQYALPDRSLSVLSVEKTGEW